MAFGGEADAVFFLDDEARGGEVVEEGFEDVGGHVGAGGEEGGDEGFVLFEFGGFQGVQDAGVAEGPPGDEAAVAGEERWADCWACFREVENMEVSLDLSRERWLRGMWLLPRRPRPPPPGHGRRPGRGASWRERPC